MSWAGVLPVLDAAHEDCVWLRFNSTKTMEVTPEQLEQARAAVAELVEADTAYDATCARSQRYPCPGMDEHVRAARKRRAIALSRVIGGDK